MGSRATFGQPRMLLGVAGRFIQWPTALAEPLPGRSPRKEPEGGCWWLCLSPRSRWWPPPLIYLVPPGSFCVVAHALKKRPVKEHGRRLGGQNPCPDSDGTEVPDVSAVNRKRRITPRFEAWFPSCCVWRGQPLRIQGRDDAWDGLVARDPHPVLTRVSSQGKVPGAPPIRAGCLAQRSLTPPSHPSLDCTPRVAAGQRATMVSSLETFALAVLQIAVVTFIGYLTVRCRVRQLWEGGVSGFVCL